MASGDRTVDPPQRFKPKSIPPGQTGAGKSTPEDDSMPTGRVRHDERGNAVWDWLKDTGRNAIEATSRLLKKLEVSHLEVEDKKDEELRIQSDRDPGGGYDPYNQSTKPPGRPPRKGR